MPEQNEEKKVKSNKLSGLIRPILVGLLIVGTMVMVGTGSMYVINKDSFQSGAYVTEAIKSNATMDPKKGIVTQVENEDGTTSNVDIEEIFEQINGADTYLEDDEYSTKEEKLQYLINAELVTSFPYISSLDGDESKLNGVLKFYRYTSQLEVNDAQNSSEEENLIEINPKKLFYIGDSWIEDLKNYLANNVNNEYPGENHFWCQSGLGARDNKFSNENLKREIDEVSSQVSSIVIMLGLYDRSEAAANRMNEIVNFLSTTYQNKTIYVLKVPHVGKAYYNETDDITAQELNMEINEYNPIILKNCSEKTNVKFIDTTSNMLDEDSFYLNENYDSEDGLHLEVAGLELWYKNIKECIAKGKSSANVAKYLMTYLSKEEFDKKLSQTGNREIFKYFTINEENEIVIATWAKTNRTVTSNDPEVGTDTLNEESSLYTYSSVDEGTYSAGRYTITEKSLVEYDSLVQQYSMPFNLLWAFLVQTNDYAFVKEIADLAYESEICIGIYDNETERVTINTERYKKILRYTENTELIMPGANETNPSFNISDAKYSNVITHCYSQISESGEILHYNETDSSNRYTRQDGELHQYYIKTMTEDGIITELCSNPNSATEFETTTTTINLSASNPSIGVFYADTWMAKWEKDYQMMLGDNSSSFVGNSRNDGEYKSLSGDRISNSLLGSGEIGTHLTQHSVELRNNAIDEIVENTNFRISTPVDTGTVISHMKSCSSCSGKLEVAFGKPLEELLENYSEAQLGHLIMQSGSYSGGDSARNARKQIYEHAKTVHEQSEETAARSREGQFVQQLKTKITYNQWPTAQEANAQIMFYTSMVTSTYKYEEATSTVEEEGEKFKNIVNKSEFYDSKQAILKRTEWFWEYIRESEDTEGLEDILRVIFNIAFDTNQFGKFEEDEIKDIFIMFEPHLVEMKAAGNSYSQLKKYIRSWEAMSMLKYINGEIGYTSSVARCISEDKAFYYVCDDGSGNPVIGFGIDIFNGSYATEIMEETGYTIEQLKDTSGKIAIPVEIIDELEERTLRNKLQTMKNWTAELNLTTYQLYALVSRAYNCGDVGAVGESGVRFKEAYNTYYNPEIDNMYGVTLGDAAFDNALYINYMKNPVRDNKGNELLGLIRRRRSEWTLFQTGYMDLLDEWVNENDILSAAQEVHDEEMDWEYYSDLSQLRWGDIEYSINNPNKATCCSTYVSCVLYRAGYFTEEEMNAFNYNSPLGLNEKLSECGWEEITDELQLEAGDIVFINRPRKTLCGPRTNICRR